MQNKYQSNLQNEDSHDEQTDYKQSNFEIQLDEKVEIQIDQDKFPFCIVWTPIPCLSWLFPIIGHTGICGSDGIQHDFVGPYYVAVGENPFGRPLKYIKLDKSQMKIQNYDLSIFKADQDFGKIIHNLCCNNCHSHVARALNYLEYQGKTNWTMFGIFWLLMTQSQYVNNSAIIKTYACFTLMAIFYILFFF